MQSRLCTFLVSVVTLLVLSNCQTPDTTPGSPQNDYIPLETGQYVVYTVEEQRYALNAKPVHQYYQRKEVIGESYQDVTGQKAFRLLRFRRSEEGQPWQSDSIWSVRIVNNEVIRTENGRDFIKLMLPIQNELNWDGNRHNILGTDTYTARNVNAPFYVQDKKFDNTVTVIEQNDSTLISQDTRIDVYAQQVGLIYQERTQLQFCSASPACIGRNQIDYGTRQIHRLRAYGHE